MGHPRSIEPMNKLRRLTATAIASAGAAMAITGCGPSSQAPTPSPSPTNCYGLMTSHCVTTLGPDGVHPIPVVTPTYP